MDGFGNEDKCETNKVLNPVQNSIPNFVVPSKIVDVQNMEPGLTAVEKLP